MSEVAHTMPRRDFIKLAGKTVLGLAGIGAATLTGTESALETSLVLKGEFEAGGTKWHPIYERHDLHEQILIPAHIPPDTDVLSVEGTIKVHNIKDGKIVEQNILQCDISSLLVGKTEGLDTTPPTSITEFPSETLTYLKNQDIPVAFGDIMYTSSLRDYDTTLDQWLQTRTAIGEVMIDSGVVVAAASRIFEEKIVNRRGFLHALAAGLTTAGLAAYLPARLKGEIHDGVMNAIQKHAGERIWGRIHALSSDLVPENLNDMFREIIQANKLMTLAHHLQREKGAKPKIAYNWHMGHRGIEDWLRLGPDITRAAILAYPNEVLQKVIEANNNDPRCLTAIRLVHVPQSLEVLPSEQDGNFTITNSTIDPNEQIRDIIIEDNILAAELQKRGLIPAV